MACLARPFRQKRAALAVDTLLRHRLIDDLRYTPAEQILGPGDSSSSRALHIVRSVCGTHQTLSDRARIGFRLTTPCALFGRCAYCADSLLNAVPAVVGGLWLLLPSALVWFNFLQVSPPSYTHSYDTIRDAAVPHKQHLTTHK